MIVHCSAYNVAFILINPLPPSIGFGPRHEILTILIIERGLPPVTSTTLALFSAMLGGLTKVPHVFF